MATRHEKLLAAFLLLLHPTMSVAQSLLTLEDGDLSAVSGQHGIAIDIEYRLNSDASGNALSTGFGNCQNTHLCNIAIHSNARDSAGGEWLVLKDVYMSYKVNDLKLDGVFTPNVGTDYADPSRFFDSTSTTCLLNGQAASSSCATAVRNRPILQFSFPDNSGFTADIEFHQHIGRAALQYGETGPSTDNGKSFLGVLVSDSRPGQLRSQVDIGGRAFLSGF